MLGGGWGVNVLFSLNHCFLILKHVLGGPRWKSKEIQASRLFSCQFQVSFMPILCQFYAKKTCIFLHGFDPAPSPFDIVKKMQDWYGGTSPTNDNATKVRSVEDLCPRKKLVWQHGCSNLIHKRPSSLKNSELQACQVDTSMGQCEARV